MTVIYIDFLLVILMEMVERILSFTSLVMEIGFLEHMMLANNQLNWNFVGNTANFGNLLDGHHILWDGDFNGDGRADILFHFSDDQNWFLGTYDVNLQMNWNFVGNTANFGNLLDGHHILWDGDFNGDGRADILFHFSDDQNWFLGTYDGRK